MSVGSLIAVGIIEGPGTPTGGITAADVWNYKLESGVSAKQMMRLFAAVLGGWAKGLDSENPAFSSPWNEDKIRLQYATDKSGNRITQMVIDLD